MNVPATYARVIAVCPEARVEGLCRTRDDKYWEHDDLLYCGNTTEESIWFGDKIAESIIVAHWLTLLKPYHMLHKDLNGEWCVAKEIVGYRGPFPFVNIVPSCTNRLELLADYIERKK